jgi:type I restriction enzyme S subunit
VKSKELLDGTIRETSEHITDAGLKNSSAKYYQPGTVLLAMYGANVGQLGLLGIPATVNQAVCGLCVNPSRAEPRYVFYALLKTRRDLVAQAAGAAQQNLNQELIRQFPIPLPPLATQRKIVAILSAYDDLMETNGRRIQTLEEMAKRIYREWFIDFRYPGHDNVSLVDSDLGPIPQGWEVRSLDEVCSRITDGAHASPPSTEVGMPMASVKDMTHLSLNIRGCRMISPEDYSTLCRQGCQPLAGDVLVSKDGAKYLDKVIPVYTCETVVLLSSIALLRPNRAITSDVLTAALKDANTKQRLKGHVSGAAIPRVVLKDFKIFRIVLPPVELQRRFDETGGTMRRAAATMENINRTLRATRDFLLPRVFSGEVAVDALDIDVRHAA